MSDKAITLACPIDPVQTITIWKAHVDGPKVLGSWRPLSQLLYLAKTSPLVLLRIVSFHCVVVLHAVTALHLVVLLHAAFLRLGLLLARLLVILHLIVL